MNFNQQQSLLSTQTTLEGEAPDGLDSLQDHTSPDQNYQEETDTLDKSVTWSRCIVRQFH
jgi:hypothetical protein